jgi:ribosomal protein L12E/L44/L45/RPP1/RPP2
MMYRAFAAALLFALPPAAGAQEAPKEAPKEAPAAAPEAQKPEPDRQHASAAKLAGLIRFVGESCQEVRPDYERFKAVVAAMGVDIDAISKGELLMRSMSYTEAYRKNVDESCRKAAELFGEKGTSIPGLVLRKAS